MPGYKNAILSSSVASPVVGALFTGTGVKKLPLGVRHSSCLLSATGIPDLADCISLANSSFDSHNKEMV